MTPSTHLTVSEDIADEDYDSPFVIQYKAFSNEPVIKACNPGGLEAHARSKNVARFIRQLTQAYCMAWSHYLPGLAS